MTTVRGLTGVLLLLSLLVWAQAPQRLTSVEGITEYQLANGLRVLLFPDPTKATFTVNLTYLVGSAHENYGETGMAHLLEHLAFKGTPANPNIMSLLNDRGARFNATTWYDRTNYYATLTASEENLKWLLNLEADRMVNSRIAASDLKSEMTVVRNEFEMGENSPGNVLFERVLSTAYLWHNYGKSTIGSRADIENVPIERLQAFYRHHYQPDNAVLLVAGKFDPEKALAYIQDSFGKLPKPSRTLAKIYTLDPTQDGERSVTLRRAGDVQAVLAAYHVPAGAHPDIAALDVLNRILTAAPAGRLHKALVETKKAAAVSGIVFHLRDPGFLAMDADVRKESSLDEARDTFLKTIDDMIAKPASGEEVERAKTELLKNIELTLNNSDRVGLELSEWIAQGDWRLFFLNRDRIRKVTPADVQRVAAAYLKPSNRTLGLFIPTDKPERSEIPATPDVISLVKDYKGDAKIAEGEAFDPSPANIESRTRRAKLPNGTEVALLSKKTRGATVVVSGSFRYGDEKSLMNREIEGTLAGGMLLRGTTKHTRQQIKDEFDKLKARVNVGGGATAANFSIETTRQNLPAVLRLVAEVLREPAFPESEFEQLKQQRLAQAEELLKEPQAVAGVAMQKHMNPYPKGDVRYPMSPQEEIEDLRAATLAGAKKFYTDFYGASNGQLAIVGDCDEKEITALLTETLGSWKSPRPFTRIPQKYHAVPAVNKSFETPDKANAFFVASLNLPLRDDDPDYPALSVGNYMLGGGLNSRLWNRVRQKEGLSYGVGSQLQASPLDPAGAFSALAIYAPQNLVKLEAAMQEEVAKAVKEGFTADELTKAKTAILQQRQVQRAQDGSLAGRLANYLFIKRTLQWDAEYEKKIEALTVEHVNAALRKHIDPAKISVFKAGDFAKGEKK